MFLSSIQRYHELEAIEHKFKLQLEQTQSQLSDCSNRAKEREADLSAEIGSLKKIIRDLQDRLGNYFKAFQSPRLIN